MSHNWGSLMSHLSIALICLKSLPSAIKVKNSPKNTGIAKFDGVLWMNGYGQKLLSPQSRQVNMSHVCYHLHQHCILKTLCMVHWQRGVLPSKKTNSMITYFDSHTTNTSDVMFKWYGINRVMSNLFKLGIHMDSLSVFIKWQRLFVAFDLPKVTIYPWPLWQSKMSWRMVLI